MSALAFIINIRFNFFVLSHIFELLNSYLLINAANIESITIFIKFFVMFY
jgi:hypothetical protein